MLTLSQLLGNVYENVYVSGMKKPYSDPKIYTGGVDVSRWGALSEEEKKEALAKRWYAYFSFRDPNTGRLARQTPITKDANQYKKMRDRLAELRVLQRNLIFLLERGANPYGDNTQLTKRLFPATDLPNDFTIDFTNDLTNESNQNVAVTPLEMPQRPVKLETKEPIVRPWKI